MTNLMKEKLLRGLPALGISIMIPSPQLVEIAGRCGYDWVLLDCEHGSISLETVELMVMAAEASNITPLIRPASKAPGVIGQYLDRGVQGVQIPHVTTAEEARALVREIKCYPEGERSLAVGTRSAGYGFGLRPEEYAKQANIDMLICLQVEDRDGITNLTEIAAVEGVDVIFLGPSDLSQSLGHPGDFEHPAVKSVIDAAVQEIVQAGKIAGTAGKPSVTTERLAQGFNYYYTHLTTLLQTASAEYLSNKK